MKSISETFRIETLAEKPEKTKDAVPKTLGVKTTPGMPRADLFELEQAYISDPTINNGINKFVSVIMSSGYKLVGSEESVAFFEKFLASIGTKGGNTDWDRLLEIIFRHQLVYGRAFNEIIYNVEGTRILDLDFIDPKKMDYAKDGNNKILLNKFSNPIGWIETIPSSEKIGGSYKTDTTTSEISVDSNQIFFKPDKIAHYKMSEIGDGFYGIGLVEPILKTSNRKLAMMKALAEFVLRTGFPIKVYKVGDPNHEPTEELLRRTVEELEKTNYRSSFAVPYYVQPELLEPKKLDKLKEYFTQFVDEEVTVLGPKAFVTGLGESTNKATLSRQEFLYKLTMKDVISNTVKVIENEIFSEIAYLEGLSDYPKIVWGEINLEELDSKAERIVKYANSGIITPDEDLEAMIRNFEGLPPLDKSKIKESKKEIPVETDDTKAKDGGSEDDKKEE